MTIPQWMLLGFAVWTMVVLIGPIGVYRWNLILRGARGIHSFPADGTQGPDWYRRSMRAHANCVENLPVFASLVAIATFVGGDSVALDVLACCVLSTRIGQTVTHVGFRETQRSVSIRFSFFSIQLGSMFAMAMLLAAA